MGYPARTFYKCVRFDYRDLYRGTIDFKKHIDGEPFRLTRPLDANPRICSPDVVHASPLPAQAAHYGSNAIRFTRGTHGRLASVNGVLVVDPRLRMIECQGRPVVHDRAGVPKYGFRELTLVRVVPADEVLEMLLDSEYYGQATTHYQRWPNRYSGRSEDYSWRVHQFCAIHFPFSGRLHQKHWARRPRLPHPAK